MTTYTPGDLVTVSTSPGFKTTGDVIVDPTEVRLRWRDPFGNETLWVYGTDVEVVRVSTGLYTADIPAIYEGTYIARWEGEDNGATAAHETSFDVESLFDLQSTTPRAALRYLTPLRYRRAAFGINLDEKSDADLAALIVSATAMVNSFCSASPGHDFRGGSVTGEEHVWPVATSHYTPSGRIWPYHGRGVLPVSVSKIRIQVTPTQYIDFLSSSNAVFTNATMGYAEPVGSAVTTSLFSAIPPYLLTSPVALVDYTYGRTYTSTNEVPTILDDGRLLASQPFWTNTPPTVKEDGVTLTVTTDYTYDAEEGTVTLVDLDRTKTYTLTYGYKLDPGILQATSLVTTDLLGYSNINASGLTGLSGIRVEEIELRQSSRVGFVVQSVSPAAQVLLAPHKYVTFA